MTISLKMVHQYMVIFFNCSPTSNHFHPLQVGNCDSNSRLVVDEDDNVKSGLKGLRRWNIFMWTKRTKTLHFIWIPLLWVYSHYKYLTLSVNIRICQLDVTFWRLKSVPALKGLIIITKLLTATSNPASFIWLRNLLVFAANLCVSSDELIRISNTWKSNVQKSSHYDYESTVIADLWQARAMYEKDFIICIHFHYQNQFKIKKIIINNI